MRKFSSTTAIALLIGMVLGLLLFGGGTYVSAVPSVVNSFNARTGNVTLSSTDVTNALTFAPAKALDLAATNSNLANNFYTKSTSDSRYAALGSSYTKAESDARYPRVSGGLRVLDSVGNEVGAVTDIPGPGRVIALRYMPTLDRWFYFDVDKTGVGSFENLFVGYETTDCTGTPYANPYKGFGTDSNALHQRVAVCGDTVYFATGPEREVYLRSFQLSPSDDCQPTDNNGPLWAPVATVPVSVLGLTPPFKLSK